MGNRVGELIVAAVARHRADVAFRERERLLTFAEAGERIARLSNALRAVSADTGVCVAILLSNRIEYAEADLAIAVAGKVRAPVTTRLSDEERLFCLRNVAAETLITELVELDRVAALLPSLPDLKRVLVVDAVADQVLPPIAIAYERALTEASPLMQVVEVAAEAPAVVRHTSGTTGRPKGAVISQQARLAAMRHSIADEWEPVRGDCFLHVAPMGHASGDKVLTFFTTGAANAFVPRFSPETFAADVRTLEATCTFLVPTMLHLLLEQQNTALPLRNITYGGSPIAPQARAAALAQLGPVLTQIYGTTETPHPVLVLDQAAHVLPETAEVTGRPADGIELRIVDDAGVDLPVGEAGELWVRGANVMSGYWNDPAATAEVLVDGWYRTGDVARVDAHGWYSVVDRKKDLIISGGLNVYPAEVEAALLRHPAVAEAAVVGLPDVKWGEVVAAAVVARPGQAVTAEELVAHCATLLAGYKKPRHIEFRDSLPKTATGKILKRTLREQS